MLYQLSYSRITLCTNLLNHGEGRIRTSEGLRRQIYSLIPLATRVPLPIRISAGDGIRTRDLLITNQLLYQLSYASIMLLKKPYLRRCPRRLSFDVPSKVRLSRASSGALHLSLFEQHVPLQNKRMVNLVNVFRSKSKIKIFLYSLPKLRDYYFLP